MNEYRKLALAQIHTNDNNNNNDKVDITFAYLFERRNNHEILVTNEIEENRSEIKANTPTITTTAKNNDKRDGVSVGVGVAM